MKQSYVKKLSRKIITFNNVINFLFQDTKLLNENSVTYDIALKTERVHQISDTGSN